MKPCNSNVTKEDEDHFSVFHVTLCEVGRVSGESSGCVYKKCRGETRHVDCITSCSIPTCHDHSR